MSEPQKEECVKWYEENKGETSAIRLMCMTSLWTSILYGIICIIMAAFNFTLAAQFSLGLAFIHVVAAYAPKAIQKVMENENFFLFKK